MHQANAALQRPMALFVLAALAKRSGWDVELIDERLPAEPTKVPDLVGISIWTRMAPRAYELASTYRRGGTPVLVGGVHPSLLPREALRYADSVVAGEAETVMRDVLEDALDGRLQPIYHGRWTSIDEAPTFTEMLEFYSAKPFDKLLLHNYQTTRGCRFNCDFCSVIRINGRGPRHLDPERVVEDFRILSRQRPKLLGKIMLHLVDDDLASDIEYMKVLCEHLARAKLPVKWGTQASIGVARDPELLDVARAAGLDELYIGFESVSRDSLIEANKKNRPSEYRKLIAAIHKRRIAARGGGSSLASTPTRRIPSRGPRRSPQR